MMGMSIEAPWPMFGHDPQHTGRSKHRGTRRNVWKWKLRLEEEMSSPLLVVGSNGTVYMGDNYLYAINPDGTLKWRFKSRSIVNSTPAIGSDGTIYFGEECLYAINPDGTLKWRFFRTEYFYVANSNVTNSKGLKWKHQSYESRAEFFHVPTIDSDDMIYFTSDDGFLYILNPDGTLEHRHKLGTDSDLDSYPVIGHDGTVYVVCRVMGDSYLYAIKP